MPPKRPKHISVSLRKSENCTRVLAAKTTDVWNFVSCEFHAVSCDPFCFLISVAEKAEETVDKKQRVQTLGRPLVDGGVGVC